jgi:hypothetical protein
VGNLPRSKPAAAGCTCTSPPRPACASATPPAAANAGSAGSSTPAATAATWSRPAPTWTCPTAPGLAAVLRAFFTRNRFKAVRFSQDGRLIEAKGLSVDEITKLLASSNPRATQALNVTPQASEEGLSADEIDALVDTAEQRRLERTEWVSADTVAKADEGRSKYRVHNGSLIGDLHHDAGDTGPRKACFKVTRQLGLRFVAIAVFRV